MRVPARNPSTQFWPEMEPSRVAPGAHLMVQSVTLWPPIVKSARAIGANANVLVARVAAASAIARFHCKFVTAIPSDDRTGGFWRSIPKGMAGVPVCARCGPPKIHRSVVVPAQIGATPYATWVGGRNYVSVEPALGPAPLFRRMHSPARLPGGRPWATLTNHCALIPDRGGRCGRRAGDRDLSEHIFILLPCFTSFGSELNPRRGEINVGSAGC
jgi:hypothetical protein